MKLKRQLSCFLAIYLLSSPAYTQDDEMADIDEWQTLKVEAAKDPFANTNQFSINFANYAVEEWCDPLRVAADNALRRHQDRTSAQLHRRGGVPQVALLRVSQTS